MCYQTNEYIYKVTIVSLLDNECCSWMLINCCWSENMDEWLFHQNITKCNYLSIPNGESFLCRIALMLYQVCDTIWLVPIRFRQIGHGWVVIGIDHDMVCAGVVGTAIRNSTSCAGRRAAAPAGTTSAVPDCSTNHDSADRISGQFLFYHDHNLQKVRETCVFDVSYRCSFPSAFA